MKLGTDEGATNPQNLKSSKPLAANDLDEDAKKQDSSLNAEKKKDDLDGFGDGDDDDDWGMDDDDWGDLADNDDRRKNDNNNNSKKPVLGLNSLNNKDGKSSDSPGAEKKK